MNRQMPTESADDGESSHVCGQNEKGTNLGAYMTKDTLKEDKERMDKFAEDLMYQRPVKEWALLYYVVVAVGHLLEWAVTRRTDETQTR